MAVVLGTAGHIDHGKTSLVRALTGIDCDRLQEEKRRGITIELGFAWVDLPGGERLGIVDVPGHERFVKNMVAGAAGVDMVMLVIAADEGIMPQTREHLEICSLLGIRTGLVALTKTDMVDADWLEMVQEEVRGFLEGTFLDGAPIFPVSATTGAGVDALRAHLIRTAVELPAQRRSDIFRLPVDRVFSMKGHGTVVTGTVISGVCNLGDELRFMPADLPTRARGLQRHSAAADSVQPGQRSATVAASRGSREAGSETTPPQRTPMTTTSSRFSCVSRTRPATARASHPFTTTAALPSLFTCVLRGERYGTRFCVQRGSKTSRPAAAASVAKAGRTPRGPS